MCASFKNEVDYRCREFFPTEHTLNKLWEFSLFLSDPHGKFGALLCGKYGNGKSTMLYAFQNALNFLTSKGHIDRKQWPGIEIVPSKDVVYYAKRDYGHYQELMKRPMLAIDDYGEEPKEAKDYGDIIQPVIDLIEYRYNRQLFTLATTNLAPDQFKDVYSARIADRLREMMTIINFGNEKSFRS